MLRRASTEHDSDPQLRHAAKIAARPALSLTLGDARSVPWRVSTLTLDIAATDDARAKQAALLAQLAARESIVVAYSGGVDSALPGLGRAPRARRARARGHGDLAVLPAQPPRDGRAGRARGRLPPRVGRVARARAQRVRAQRARPLLLLQDRALRAARGAARRARLRGRRLRDQPRRHRRLPARSQGGGGAPRALAAARRAPGQGRDPRAVGGRRACRPRTCRRRRASRRACPTAWR